MKIKEINAFFLELDRRIDIPVRIVITGGAAAILFGGTRATHDIDFEADLKIGRGTLSDKWEKLQKSLDETARITGISPQYSDDIDRWSSIVMPKKKSRLYKKIGKVELRIFEPGLWAIGKLSRYLESDTADLVEVLAKVGTKPVALAKLWGQALGGSPPSPAQSEFRRHVDHFFDGYAERIWGKKVDPVRLKEFFLESAQKSRRKPTRI